MASEPKKTRAITGAGAAAATIAATASAAAPQAPRFAPVLDDVTESAAQNIATGDVSGHPYGDSDQAQMQALAEHQHRQATTAPVDPIAAADGPQSHLYVVDRSATAITGPRVHELLDPNGVARPYKFEPYTPNRLPLAIALKFLKSEGFVLTDADGNEQEFRRTPKRPEELAAGEQLAIKPDETIARYDELSTKALFFRCAVLPGGEVVAQSNNRGAMIRFIIDHFEAIKRKNSERERRYGADAGLDEFTPPAEADDFY